MKTGIMVFMMTFVCMRSQVSNEDGSQKETNILQGDDSSENTTQRIVGGYEADITEFPWQVAITYYKKHNCGGSIINPYFILTAAHCTHGLSTSQMTVRVGSTYMDRGGMVYEISYKIEHPKYQVQDFIYDIALLKLTEELVYSDKVKPVNLPHRNDPDPEPGTFATVSGFGQLDAESKKMSRHLMATDVPIISRRKCKKLYPRYVVDETMICAAAPEGGKDACSGDSGGPLILDDVQIGVVSWGIGCASAEHPGVYASVKKALKFIKGKSKIREKKVSCE
ncbi:trypsin-1-like [Coccinella septempunctata]|uniref:trypsin-1-like n=1 Tax=Coccinella septempunctata TaxID=41139 RepID=UPI001D09937A|nr:trypsin-1-like [Coccinella septempunctata]